MLSLIITTLKEYVDIDEKKITPETNFLLDLNLTSFDIVTMVGELEKNLGIEIPDTVIRDLDTVEALTEYLEKKI